MHLPTLRKRIHTQNERLPVPDEKLNRVQGFKAFVEKTETEAAYKLKEENDAKRTTA